MTEPGNNAPKLRKQVLIAAALGALAAIGAATWNFFLRQSHVAPPPDAMSAMDDAEAVPMRATIRITPDAAGIKWLSPTTAYTVEVEFGPGSLPPKVLVVYEVNGSSGGVSDILCTNCSPYNPAELFNPNVKTSFSIKTTQFQFDGTKVLKITVTRPGRSDPATDKASAQAKED